MASVMKDAPPPSPAVAGKVQLVVGQTTSAATLCELLAAGCVAPSVNASCIAGSSALMSAPKWPPLAEYTLARGTMAGADTTRWQVTTETEGLRERIDS